MYLFLINRDTLAEKREKKDMHGARRICAYLVFAIVVCGSSCFIVQPPIFPQKSRRAEAIEIVGWRRNLLNFTFIGFLGLIIKSFDNQTKIYPSPICVIRKCISHRVVLSMISKQNYNSLTKL